MRPRKESIKRIIEDVIADDDTLDTMEIHFMVSDLEDEKYSELLPDYIPAIFAMRKWIGVDRFDIENRSWLWQVEKIVNGEYPLENIPESVRDLVKELYYAVKK